jgi:peroxiredoxin/outer membrane murein-binding lipoprotein Lpp
MKKMYWMALAALVLSACNPAQKFEIEGNVSDAAGKVLHLEAATLQGIVPLDSVRLKASGSFSFKYPRPESPEYYRLRIENKIINFSIDSTETVSVTAPYADFSTAYTVEGSPNSTRIKELTLKQIKLQNDINALSQSVRAGQMGMDVYETRLATLLTDYKDEVKTKYILPDTGNYKDILAAAYFALFQKVNDYLIFDPLNNKDDIKCFAAVATSLNNFYPHADRSRNLYNIVIKGMKNTRTPQQRALEIPKEKISEIGILDISLRDLKGNVHKLSELKGQVVILDFTIYQSAVSTPHNIMLNTLYEKYHSRGLQIYQVSLDADEHFWKTIADNLPWICVRDASGIYSSVAAMYSVTSVPELFLINRNSELSARGETIKNLEASVKALL